MLVISYYRKEVSWRFIALNHLPNYYEHYEE